MHYLKLINSITNYIFVMSFVNSNRLQFVSFYPAPLATVQAATRSTLRHWTFISEHSVSHYVHKERTTSFYSLWKSTWKQSHVAHDLPREMATTSQGRRALISARMCGTFRAAADSCCHGIDPGSGRWSASTSGLLSWIFTSAWCVCRLWRPAQINASMMESLQLIYWAEAQGFMFVWDLIELICHPGWYGFWSTNYYATEVLRDV